ncbi:MAG: FtsQ-type POTRA domain-containing protein [Acidobacteria bacterium]|nr:FtsQ-type POTRA domain-containing protein [Acidobacteriota bacterium]
MLKEQVISPRGGRGGGSRGGDVIVVTTEGRAGKIVQRPTARRNGKAQDKRGAQQRAKSRRGAWGKALAWAPLAAKVLIAVCAGLVLFKGYRAAAASSFFELRGVDVSGVAQASEDQIRQIVRREAAAGVWKADLGQMSAEIGRLPWVRSAVVTRVLPDGLRVRITERVPRLVVRNSAGQFVWVDDDGVVVGALKPTQAQPSFFMRGFDEAATDAARAENRERAKVFMTLAGEWEAAGLASRVSELNLDDLRDVRAQLAGDDSQIEIRLGSAEWTKRLRQALETLDAQKRTPRGAFITYVDMTQGKRAVVGFNPHAPAAPVAGTGINEIEPTGDAATNAAGAANTTNAKDESATSGGAKGAARANVEARAAKSDGAAKSGEKSKPVKSVEGRKGGEQSVGQSGEGRPRRVKGE